MIKFDPTDKDDEQTRSKHHTEEQLLALEFLCTFFNNQYFSQICSKTNGKKNGQKEISLPACKFVIPLWESKDSIKFTFNFQSIIFISWLNFFFFFFFFCDSIGNDFIIFENEHLCRNMNLPRG
jgi:hypothetical protein